MQLQLPYDFSQADLTGEILRKNQLNSDLLINHILVQHRMGQYLLLLAQRGSQRIAAGRARATFLFSAKDSLAARVPEKNRKLVRGTLAAFDDALRRNRLSVHDLPDGRALAFVMAYLGYRGEDPGPARLARLRKSYRESILRNEVYQGMTDRELQAEYEADGYRATLAVLLRREAEKKTGDERERLLAQARSFAAEVLKKQFKGPVEGIELTATGFGERGERLASSGGGSTGFSRRPLLPEERERLRLYRYSSVQVTEFLTGFGQELRRFGGSDSDLADGYATAFALLVMVREKGGLVPSPSGWRGVRDHIRTVALKDASLLRTGDGDRQLAVDTLAVEVMGLLAQKEANRKAVEEGDKKKDGSVFDIFKPRDESGVHAGIATDLLGKWFKKEELPELERRLRR